MKALRALLVAAATACSLGGPGLRSGDSSLAGPGLTTRGKPNILFQAPFTTTAPYIEDGVTDTNTVMHCRDLDFSANTLTCRVGGAWTTQGTLTTDSTYPAYPNGTGAAVRAGMTSYSGSNYFKLGTGAAADALDFAIGQNFSACVVWKSPTSFASASVPIFSNGTCGGAGRKGWYIFADSTNLQFVLEASAGSSFVAQDVIPPPQSLNITCVGRSGTSQFIKNNLNTMVTGGSDVSSSEPSNALPAQLGRFTDCGAGYNMGDGVIYEFWASTTTPSDALFTKIATRFWGLSGGGRPITFSRTGNQTFLYGSFLFSTATGTPAVDPSKGVSTEQAHTNLALRSEAIDNAAWTKTAGITVTADQAVAPDGTTTMELLDNTAGADFLQTANQSAVTAASAGPYISSAWVKPFGASNVMTVATKCGAGAPSACACACNLWTGAVCTCTAAISGNLCIAYRTVTAPTRIAAIGTCPVGEVAPNITLCPGQYATSKDKGYYWGGQLENNNGQGSKNYAGAYSQTVGTSTAVGAPVMSIANPVTSNDVYWCVDVTYEAGPGINWSTLGSTPHPWSIGTLGAANSADFYLGTTGNVLLDGVRDGTNTLKSINAGSIGADGAAHRVILCNENGTLVSYIDNGARTAPAPSGVGTGIIVTQPATFYIGTSSASTGVDGFIKNFTISRRH